jgi:hypothetical protein
MTRRRSHRNVFACGLKHKPSAAHLHTGAYFLYRTCRLRITGETLREFWGLATRLHFQDIPGALHTIGINTDRMGQKSC